MNIILKHFESFISALGLSLVLISLIILICRKFGLYDKIGGRKNHKVQVGRLGGVGIIISFSVIFYLFIADYIPEGISVEFLSVSLLIIFVMGLFDDLKGLRAKYKFVLQILASALTVYAGVRIPVASVFADLLPYTVALDSFFTVIWILAFMNAVNLIDGMDGLSSGLVLIALLFFMAVGLHSGNELLILMTIALMGSIIGFYIFNFPPAKIFLGDAGAYCIGFIMSLLIPVSFNSVISLKITLAPVIIFLIPFLDVGQVMVRRMWLKSGLFTADSNHVHHKLLATGYSRINTLGIIYTVAVIFGCLGVLIWNVRSTYSPYIFVVTLLLSSILLLKISVIDNRTRSLSGISEPGFKWWKQNLRFYAESVHAVILNINGEKKPVSGNLFDISIDGFFYSTSSVSIVTGERLLVALMFTDRKPLKLTAEVVWINSNDDKLPAGFGCRFSRINVFACKKIKYHLISNNAVIRKRVKGEIRHPAELRLISGKNIKG